MPRRSCTSSSCRRSAIVVLLDTFDPRPQLRIPTEPFASGTQVRELPVKPPLLGRPPSGSGNQPKRVGASRLKLANPLLWICGNTYLDVACIGILNEVHERRRNV